ncbi:MAG: major capsid protein [Halothiobacillus sp.]
MSMNPSQVRIIDPILSNIAQGYTSQDFVGNSLFPRVPVQTTGGQIIEFGKEAFRLYNARRVPGAATRRMEVGYLGKPFTLLQDSLEGKVPREFLRDAARVPGIDLGTRATNTVMSALMRGLEVEQAGIALNAASYQAANKVDLSAAKWSNDANKPTQDIEAAREAVRTSIGVYPNTLLLSAKAFNAARNNANVIARFQYTSADSITAAMLANLWGIDQVIIGTATYYDDNAGAFTDIWGADAVLAYVPKQVNSMAEPSYGYTYTMEGNPLVEQAYYDENPKSWFYPVVFERAPVLSGMLAGFLFQNAA